MTIRKNSHRSGPMGSGTRYLNQFPPPLLDELVAGRWLPIVGSGLSRNASVPRGKRLPLWDGLGKAVAADITDHSYSGPVEAISSYEHEDGRRELVNRLYRELLVDDAEPGDVHRSFCRLRFDRVVTTNFESLLERGYAEVGERCDVVVDEEQLPIPTRRDVTVLLKLHGDLRHPARLVATEDDFDGFLGRYPILATHLASLLIDRIPVLIGYSLEDPDLRQVLAVLRDRLGPMLPPAYALVVGADSSAVARYGRRGIKVINLPGTTDRYGEILAATFEQLGRHWRDRVLGQVQITEERPLEEVETSVDRSTSRLCYFSVPVNLLSQYRDQVFPVAELIGLVPVSGFDVDADRGNRLTAIRTLLER